MGLFGFWCALLLIDCTRETDSVCVFFFSVLIDALAVNLRISQQTLMAKTKGGLGNFAPSGVWELHVSSFKRHLAIIGLHSTELYVGSAESQSSRT